jgi:hypothetical protein
MGFKLFNYIDRFDWFCMRKMYWIPHKRVQLGPFVNVVPIKSYVTFVEFNCWRLHSEKLAYEPKATMQSLKNEIVTREEYNTQEWSSIQGVPVPDQCAEVRGIWARDVHEGRVKWLCIRIANIKSWIRNAALVTMSVFMLVYSYVCVRM